MSGIPLTPFLFPAASTSPDSFAPLPLVLIGFSFVVVVLAVLALLTFLGGKFFARRGERGDSPGSAGVAAQPPDNEVDPLTRAVIAAALYTVLPGERVRIGKITPVEEKDAADSTRR